VARSKFPVEVLTPEGEVFNDEVEMISTRTATGSIGILANHTPLLAMLDPTELRLYRSENEVVRLAQGEGYLQVADNRALILVEEAHTPDELDLADLQEKQRAAEAAYEGAEPGSEEQRLAARDKRRWEAFARVAGGSDGH
jgi:F-type H+-transporting ATPase subunit epsilon